MRAEDVLPGDASEAVFGKTSVRKGTVGAFLASVRVWSDPAASADEKAAAERDMIEAVPALRATGLLDVFEARDRRLRDLIAQG